MLVDVVGFPGEDIIFDPNILTVATGMQVSHSLAHSLTRSLTHSLAHSLTLTHSLPHSVLHV
jgi:cobalamin-dependent methionine synthase I